MMHARHVIFFEEQCSSVMRSVAQALYDNGSAKRALQTGQPGEAVELPDPYAGGMVKENPYAKKVPVNGRIVAVLKLRVDGRGLELIKQPSRAVIRGEVHELILTGEAAGPGGTVNNVAYLGFFEVLNSGVIVAGDEVVCGGITLGRLAGFDLTHFPNHLNIVVNSDTVKTGDEMGLELGSSLQFRSPK